MPNNEVLLKTTSLSAQQSDGPPDKGESPDAAPPAKGESPDAAPPPAPEKAGFLKQVWKKTGLDLPTIMLMAKGALPPIICLSAYQSDAWTAKYSTLGYLTAIMAMLSMAIQPRAKFIQSMLTSLLFICFGAAVALLQIQCVVSARHTTTPHSASNATITGTSGSKESVAYNSSASVVAAVFLFSTIYFANTFRALRPQLQLPIIQYSIFTIVTSSYCAQFPNMAAGINFVRRLLETFLTGFGIATGVSLFVLPITSRTIVAKQIDGILGLLKATLGAHGEYMQSISTAHQISPDEANDGSKITNTEASTERKEKKGDSNIDLAQAAAKMKGLVSAIGALFGKINLEVGFAKREVAFGKLGPEEFDQMFMLLREVLLPVFGMTTFINIMQSVKERTTAKKAMIDNNETVDAIRHLEADEWAEIMSMSREDFIKLKVAMIGGLTHISYVLEFSKKPKAPTMDIEKAERTPSPGDANFSTRLESDLNEFHARREGVLRRWCDRKGVDLPPTFWDDPSQQFSMKEQPEITETVRQKMNQQQLYLILYAEFLIWSMGKSILKLVRYADSKVEDGTMAKKRLIIPAWQRWKNYLEHAFAKVDSDDGMFDGENSGPSIDLGDSLKHRKDPEHLPPTNLFQKSTNYLRAIPRVLGSPESSFGFRAAAATLSIGVLAYIEQTHLWFLKDRVLWAMIMIAISMSAHAGQGIFGFVTRIFGTAVAMVMSMVVWYVADQKIAAILPLFYLYIMGGLWFLLKNPQLVVVAVISIVTGILIIGYELQERKIGLALATSNGQPYYKIYLLGPIRLLTVTAGLTVSFIWTYFPSVVTTHSTLRKDLGKTLYLLANYYSCVHTTVDMRLHMGAVSNPADPKAPMTRLDEARHKVFTKVITMLSRLREHSNFVKWEPTFGGRFPKETYDDLIQSMSNIFSYLSMISYSSNTFTTDPDADESGWLRDFRLFAADLNITSHDYTSTLCLVSASMTNSLPLPPYLKVPRSYALGERMESLDPELLSVRHVAEPCYAAFAVLEIASSLLTEELAHVVKKVQDLVGEVDFSFHVISTNSDGSSASSTIWEDQEKQAAKGKQE